MFKLWQCRSFTTLSPVSSFPLFGDLDVQVFRCCLHADIGKRKGQHLFQFLPRFLALVIFGDILFLSKVRKLQESLLLNQYRAHSHLPPGHRLIRVLSLQNQLGKVRLIQDEPLHLVLIRFVFHDVLCYFTTNTGHEAFSINEWLTLPIMAPRRALNPRVPTTIISALISSATCNIPLSTASLTTTRPFTVISGEVTSVCTSCTA